MEINYCIIGKGKPLLVLHGWGSRGEKWRKFAEIVSKKNFQIIIPDLPGFGESQKPDFIWGLSEYANFLDEFAKTLNLNKFYLLGHSFGGAVAVKYALKHPEKVEKIFLAGAACIREKNFKRDFFLIISKMFGFLKRISIIRKFFYKFILQSDYPYTQGIMREIYLKVIKEDLSDELKNIKTPAVIIWGNKDNIVPLKFGKLINSKIENSKLCIIPGGDHDLERKMPELLAEKIK